ncbi:MAG: ABC transporter substrate-binding protein [Firmicutes bacterium]|nr:ABC transporter substrate-binding protein [Bacillota bacterium]
MKKFTKIASLALTAAIAVTSLAGCGTGKNTGDSGSGDAKTIKIGGIGPITGAAAIYGQAVKNGAEIALEEINAKGDLKFELKFEDDENDAEKAVNAYNNLKDWGMKISMGAVTTQPCIAVSTESNSDGIFAMTPSASSPDVVKDKDLMFQMCFTDPNQGIASAKYIKEQNLGEKIAVIYNNSDVYSTGIYQKFMAEAENDGLNVVCVKTFTDDSANDFTSQLNEIKSAGADLVFLPIYYTPASLILTQAKKMQYEPKFFGVDGMDGILTLEGFDKSLAEDVMLLTPFTADAQDDATKSFVEKYNNKFKETPNQFAADGYDVVNAIYEACVKAGVTADMTAEEIGTKLAETLTSDDFKFDGITGNGMFWSQSGEVSKDPKGMVIKNGVYVGM